MSKSTIAMIIAFVVVLIAAIAGLIYGITTHTEPGFMETSPGFTQHDLPIRVCAGHYLGDPSHNIEARTAVVDAVVTINERLGVDVYAVQLEPSPSACDVAVIIDAPTDAQAHLDPGGDAIFTNGTRHCDVTTRNTGTTEMESLVLQHELGHCLGLAHDCWAGSIMCGGSCCTLGPTGGIYPPRIDDFDRDLLRHTFQ